MDIRAVPSASGLPSGSQEVWLNFALETDAVQRNAFHARVSMLVTTRYGLIPWRSFVTGSEIQKTDFIPPMYEAFFHHFHKKAREPQP